MVAIHVNGRRGEALSHDSGGFAGSCWKDQTGPEIQRNTELRSPAPPPTAHRLPALRLLLPLLLICHVTHR